MVSPRGHSLSTLSKNLFLIAINDLVEGMNKNVKKCIYVDDLVITCATKTVGESSRYLQDAINQVVKNASVNGFKLSKQKTHVMHFCKLRRPHYRPLLFMENCPLELKTETKFLGLIFDEKLTWKSHINGLVLRCKKFLNLIKCLSHTT